MVIFSIVLLIAGVILAIAALAVRFAGNTPILAGVDVTRVQDMAGLNRWAGDRLLLLPIVALGFGIAGVWRPVIGLVGAGFVVLVGIAVVVWILVGAERFHIAR